MASINTNAGALVALQNLSATQTQLQTTQNRISTGLKVASAKDNGAIFAIAQNTRSTVGALGPSPIRSTGRSPPWTWPSRPVSRSPTF